MNSLPAMPLWYYCLCVYSLATNENIERYITPESRALQLAVCCITTYTDTSCGPAGTKGVILWWPKIHRLETWISGTFRHNRYKAKHDIIDFLPIEVEYDIAYNTTMTMVKMVIVTHKAHPIPRPLGEIWVFCRDLFKRKMTLTHRQCTAQHKVWFWQV